MNGIIVITSDSFIDNEASVLSAILEEGAARVHIRKPGVLESDLKRLIEDLLLTVDPDTISLHHNEKLVREYRLGGFHSRYVDVKGAEFDHNVKISIPCHFLDEISEYEADYFMLSPVFDSISKVGYKSGFDLSEISRFLGKSDKTVFALGGINANNISEIKKMGFNGAALLGALWGDCCCSKDEYIKKFRKIFRQWI